MSDTTHIKRGGAAGPHQNTPRRCDKPQANFARRSN